MCDLSDELAEKAVRAISINSFIIVCIIHQKKLLKKKNLYYTNAKTRKDTYKMFKKSEMKQVEKYLQKLFKSQTIYVNEGNAKGDDAPAELMVDGQFVGVVYKNDDEGEISYDLNMTILPDDFEGI